jgi:hypothetical protein
MRAATPGCGVAMEGSGQTEPSIVRRGNGVSHL